MSTQTRDLVYSELVSQDETLIYLRYLKIQRNGFRLLDLAGDIIMELKIVCSN